MDGLVCSPYRRGSRGKRRRCWRARRLSRGWSHHVRGCMRECKCGSVGGYVCERAAEDAVDAAEGGGGGREKKGRHEREKEKRDALPPTQRGIGTGAGRIGAPESHSKAPREGRGWAVNGRSVEGSSNWSPGLVWHGTEKASGADTDRRIWWESQDNAAWHPAAKARVSVQGLAQEQATACRGQNRGDRGNSL